ncbi:MAG: aldo/keto reductase [Planctomycetota bacterium]
MEKRRLGKTGLDVSILGFGAAEIGFEGASPKTVEQLVGRALDAGVNVIDTAECYVTSEELLGKAASSRRNDYFLFTKVGHPDGFGRPDDWSGPGIEKSIERSLKRLKTDRVDLVQLHSCDVPVLEKGEAIAALERAQKRGLVRFLGYSGDSVAAKWALESGKFSVLQTSVSIADQESLDLLLPLARAKDVGVIAKRPIANAAWRSGEKKPASEYHLPYWERLRELDFDFVKTAKAAETALRFTLFQPGVSTAIVGTTKPDRLVENARLLEAGPLSEKEIEKIRSRWKKVAKPTWVGQV